MQRKRQPSHPGEVLKGLFLEPAGLTQTDLAKHLGWTITKVNQIVTKKRGITPDSALALADAFGTTPDVWLNLQRDYDLWHAMQGRKPLKLLKQAG